MPFIVAIDGPAGTGKGTITKLVAQDMGLLNVDTGAIYRSVTLAALNNKLDLQQKQDIINLIDEIKIEIKNDNGEQSVFLDNVDVTNEIRTPNVTFNVSQVSSIPEVRIKVTEIERGFAKKDNIIMEGRDIGSYVFPNADVKIYLDATSEERAKRRYLQNKENGIEIPYEELLKQINERDYNDKHREMGALVILPDAIVIDSTNMSIEEVKNKVEKIIKKKMEEKGDK